jgi:hypothetical protein
MIEAHKRAMIQLTAKYWGTQLPQKETRDALILAEKETPAIEEIKEAYLPIDDLEFVEGDRTIKSTTAGYVDHGLIDHTRTYAELFDWKFGFWPVEKADNNLQGLSYCLGMFHKYKSLEKIRFWFKQPHLNLISDVTVTRAQIPELYLRIQTVVARAREARRLGDYSSARPTVPNCNFCANLGTCPAVSAFACKVGAKFYPLQIPDNITPTMIHSGRDTVLGLRLAQVMGVWAKAFKARITDRVICGESDCPPGHVLQQRSDREVADPDKYKGVALRYITQAQYEAACSVTFGKVEEAIKDKAPRGQKKAMIEQFNSELTNTGAIKQNDPYTFLRAIADKNTENKQTES